MSDDDARSAITDSDPLAAPVGAPALGTVFGGRYRLVRVLGEGGMGLVYEAMHERLRQPVAVKVLQPKLLDNAEVVARFEREARAASQLRGPNVARVMDVDVSPDGAPYMVMELLHGHDLARELRLRHQLPTREAVGYLLQACDGMIEAHAAGIVHRDLKPSNLFLQDEPNARVVKVLDFGISKLLRDEESNVTMTYSTIGTPLYMSPEQVRSAKHVDARADQWSLAVILFELLAGRPPFTGGPTAVSAAIVADDTPSLREFAPDVPAELEQVIGRALGKKPGQRYPDVAAFADALAPFGPEDGGRRRSRASHSGSFSVVEPLREQIRVDAPTLPRELAPTMPTPSLSDGSPDRGSKEFAEAVTAAPLSPPASLATGAPWSQSEARVPVAAKRRSPLLFAGLGLVGVGAAIGLFVALSPARPSTSQGGPSAASAASSPASTPSITVGVGPLPAPPPSVSATVKPGAVETAKPAPTAKPTAKPSTSPSPPPGPSVTGAPKAPPPANTGPENPVHL